MSNFFYGLLAIIIAVAVIVAVGQVVAVPITGNLAAAEQARALAERERVAQVQAQEAGHTERMQTFALTLTGLIVIAKSPDALLLLLVLGLYGAAGYALWHTRARG